MTGRRDGGRRAFLRTATWAVAALAVVFAVPACGTDEIAGAGAAATPSSLGSTTSTSAPVTQLKGASTAPVSVPMPEVDTAQLVAVRIGSHDGYDRIVFELDGALPGYDIGYLGEPPSQDGSGDPLELEGGAALSVRLAPASGVVIGVDEVVQTYVGPDRITGDGDPVTEVVRAGDFEAQSTWVIGVDRTRPFTVSTLEGPTRIIVDVASV